MLDRTLIRPSPFLQAPYVQRGHGLMDWFRKGWSGIASLFRNTVAPNVNRALRSSTAQNLKNEAKNIARDSAVQFGIDTLSGKKSVADAAVTNAKAAADKSRKRLAQMLEQDKKERQANYTLEGPPIKKKPRARLKQPNKKKRAEKTFQVPGKNFKGRGKTTAAAIKRACPGRKPLI